MYRLEIKGMVSQRCVRHLNGVLKRMDAKAKLEIQFETQTIQIETLTELEKLKKIIQQEGYEVLKAEVRP